MVNSEISKTNGRIVKQQIIPSYRKVESKVKQLDKTLRPTGSLAQAGVLSRGTLRRNLEVQLPSEPYRYPRLPQAAKTLAAIRLTVEE